MIKKYFPLVLMSIFAVVLLFIRISMSGHYMYAFLIWNLILALIPLFLSEWVIKVNGRVKKFLLGSIWLLFLPNSFYILTDLYHLTHRFPIPLWYDMLLIMAFAMTGMLMGYQSLFNILNALRNVNSHFRNWILPMTFLYASSFGIYLGRFLRWNSWDILANPYSLLLDIVSPFINPVEHPRSIGVTIGLGTFLFLVYWALINTMNLKKEIIILTESKES